jgi:hypothetical protein
MKGYRERDAEPLISEVARDNGFDSTGPRIREVFRSHGSALAK